MASKRQLGVPKVVESDWGPVKLSKASQDYLRTLLDTDGRHPRRSTRKYRDWYSFEQSVLSAARAWWVTDQPMGRI